MLCLSAAPAFAANKDLVVTKDTSINPSFVKYGNITVKSGATLTIKSTSGFEITGIPLYSPVAFDPRSLFHEPPVRGLISADKDTE